MSDLNNLQNRHLILSSFHFRPFKSFPLFLGRKPKLLNMTYSTLHSHHTSLASQHQGPELILLCLISHLHSLRTHPKSSGTKSDWKHRVSSQTRGTMSHPCDTELQWNLENTHAIQPIFFTIKMEKLGAGIVEEVKVLIETCIPCWSVWLGVLILPLLPTFC